MVLNPDGTPNPLPIIDVYGTRRGPKMKRQDVSSMDSAADLSLPMNPSPKSKTPKGERKERSNGKQTARESHSPPSFAHNVKFQEFSPTFRPQHEMLYPQNVLLTPPPSKKNETSDSESEMITKLPTITPALHASPPSPQMALLQKALLSNPGILNLASKNPLELYAAALNQYLMANPIMHMSPPIQNWNEIAKEQQSKLLSQLASANNCVSPPVHSNGKSGNGIQQMVPTKVVQPEANNVGNSNSHVALDLRHRREEESVPGRVEDLKKRKRKGKALRYDRQMQYANNNGSFSDDEENDGVLDFSSSTGRGNNGLTNSGDYKMRKVEKYEPTVDHESDHGHGSNNNDNSCSNNTNGGSLMCKYCSISFPDPVLYTMHMKYHSGDSCPFVCKVCGKESADKVAFFLHLNTDSH